MSCLELVGIRKRFTSRRRDQLALDGVELSLGAGERVGLVGASGSGKTTLARVAMGLAPADEGTVRLFGEDTAGWSDRRWRTVRRRAQLLFQDPHAMLNPAIPVGLLLEESAALHRSSDPPRQAAARALAAVGLEGRWGALPRELSGGEQRRVGIARLLLTRPELVIADELTTGLDAALKAELVELILSHLGPDSAVVFISHDISLVLWSCARVAVMFQGRVVDQFATAGWAPDERHPHTRALLRAAGLDAGRAS